MRGRLFVTAVTLLALACGPSTMEQGAPKSTPRTRYSGLEIGPTPVGAIPDVILRDDQRSRDVKISIEYPTRGTAHPVIVFSPGFGGTNRGYVGVSSYWAANNYVVIRLDHSDRTAGVQTPEDIWTRATPAEWRDRVRDLTLVLDSLGELARRYPELEGKIDPARVGVAGHSYGAHTTMLVGGVRTYPGPVSYADPRVKAIVAMSPPGPASSRGLTTESWSELRIPALFMTGSRDQGASEVETPEWRAEAFALAAPGDKWLVTLEGARHSTFTGRTDDLLEALAREQARNPSSTAGTTGGVAGTTSTAQDRGMRQSAAQGAFMRQQELFAIARGLSLAFFDTYLRGEAAGREALEKAEGRFGVHVQRK